MSGMTTTFSATFTPIPLFCSLVKYFTIVLFFLNVLLNLVCCSSLSQASTTASVIEDTDFSETMSGRASHSLLRLRSFGVRAAHVTYPSGDPKFSVLQPFPSGFTAEECDPFLMVRSCIEQSKAMPAYLPACLAAWPVKTIVHMPEVCPLRNVGLGHYFFVVVLLLFIFSVMTLVRNEAKAWPRTQTSFRWAGTHTAAKTS